jgi:hypothetical protein
MPIVLKFGSLNLLEPSGPVQACNGIGLPYFTMMNLITVFSFGVMPEDRTEETLPEAACAIKAFDLLMMDRSVQNM